MIAWKGRVVWTIAALSLLLPAASASGAGERPCNGSVELCGRTLDKVVLPGTHNSMSNAELGWTIPNQTYTISNQLHMGVRSLLIDTYYGNLMPDGKVKEISKAAGRGTGAHTYLCHAYCVFGSSDLTTELGHIADFLAANPREVLVIVNEDYIAPEDFAKAVEESGLLPYVYQGPTGPWQTLSQMVSTNQRVVMLAQNEAGDVPWYHLGYEGPMRETPYTFETSDLLTAPDQLNESCRPNRGDDNGSLFLMNHWVLRGAEPMPADAAVVNTKEALVNRARACEARRGILPTIIAVDFFGTGDVLGAVRELNGVVAKPFLEATRPKPATVRAGRKAVFRVPVSNFGDAEATGVRVCATVPGRLARKPRCAVIASVPTGGRMVARLSLLTKKTGKGPGTVSFKVTASDGTTVSTTAKLRVKPRPKPKKRGWKQTGPASGGA